MSTYHPESAQQLKERNALLQVCLRPDPLPFPIESEYPIVLGEAGKRFSYCLNHANRLCSHANLWPRTVIDRLGREKGQVALVGNVATDPAMQGRGHMRELLSNLEEIAKKQSLDALILWSDLDQFYHKLGYQSVGHELHIGIPKEDPKRPSFKASGLDFVLNGERLDEELAPMMHLRPAAALTLKRSPEEFKAQLTIPWLDNFRAYKNGELVATALIGKGYDMVGVIHEWGAKDSTSLVALIDFIADTLPFESLMILVPDSIEAGWKAALTNISESFEKHSMALIKLLHQTPSQAPTQKREDYASLFIWGLDSI